MNSIEKETIVLFNEKENEAQIYTYNKKLKNKLKIANEKYPDIYKINLSSCEDSITCVLPKERLSINIKFPPKKELSKLRSKLAVNMHKNRVENMQICKELKVKKNM